MISILISYEAFVFFFLFMALLQSFDKNLGFLFHVNYFNKTLKNDQLYNHEYYYWMAWAHCI